MSAALRAFEESLARFADPLETAKALHTYAATILPARLFTLTALNRQAGHVRRVYSSHPDVYPLLGTKPLVEDDWLRSMQTERRITTINTAAGMEGEFPDLTLIRSLGCNASMSVPVMVGNDLLGTINILDAEGSYPDSIIDPAAALIVPAATVFLILRQHFDV